jgi:Zn-dependent M28 family amino/carboxypeptidase
VLRLSVLSLLSLLSLCAQTPSALRAHVEFLSSDSMACRHCPSVFCNITADYILAQFHAVGLEAQVQTTTAIYEIRRGDVVVRPSGPAPAWIAMNAPAKVDSDKSILIRGGKIPYTPELDPILNATGDILVRVVPAGLRNVIGVVRGAVPVLRDTYVLVTAHYDHIGEDGTAAGDRIRNGANDNASGVSGMIELARAIAAARVKPARSVVFIGFFGEESEMVGSRYYAENPVFPVDKTFAQVNLEQLGRTDDNEGPRVKAATVTGWDRSKLGAALATAAATMGIRIYKHEKFSEPFFVASDNEALAKLGVPAHTVSVAYGFPDYHAVGDEAGKLDYDNMALVVRALRAGVVALANRRTALTGAPPETRTGPAPAKPKPARVKPTSRQVK